MYLTKYFKPTSARVGASNADIRIMRTESWTTNGLWAVKKYLEPGYVSKTEKSGHGLTDDNIELIIMLDDELVEVVLDHETVDISSSVPLVSLSFGDKKIWCNAYYVAMFQKLGTRVTYKYKITSRPIDDNGSYTALHVFNSSDNLIGLIMPVNK